MVTCKCSKTTNATAYCALLFSPLCLNIAAQMISDSGDSWEEEVLPTLRADISTFLTDNDDNKLSVQ